MEEWMNTEETVTGRCLTDLAPQDLAEELAAILENKKAFDLKIMCVEGRSDVCDYYVLATGTSNTHVRSLCGELEFKATERGFSPIRVEGRGNNTWMVLDFGTVMVHILTRDMREFYRLERLYRAPAGETSSES